MFQQPNLNQCSHLIQIGPDRSSLIARLDKLADKVK
jgi:hypothetical protein